MENFLVHQFVYFKIFINVFKELILHQISGYVYIVDILYAGWTSYMVQVK